MTSSTHLDVIDAVWIVGHILDGDDEAVIEWTMFWTPRGSERRVATRGAEWFTFGADGRITAPAPSVWSWTSDSTPHPCAEEPGSARASASQDLDPL